MFRQLVGLVLLSLVAFGLAPAQANSENTNKENNDAYIYESPPIIEFGDINNSGTSNRANVLQPTFTGSSSRVFYDFEVEVTTNGDLDNFNVISACFFTSSAASRASDRETLCGYSEAEPKTPSDPNPSRALSMAWTTDGTFRIDGTNNHELGTSTHETFTTSRNFNDSTITYDGHRLKFQFALSHAAINTSDWTMRVVAVSTPTPDGGTTAAAQRTELIFNDCTYEDQLTDSCGVPGEYGVAFYGGFASSTSRSVDYGSINENSSSTVRDNLSTGSYYANDEAILTIAASDFKNLDDTIPLQTDAVGDEKNHKELTLACTGDSGEVLLDSTVNDLFIDQPLSSDSGTPEDEKTAPTHSCQLHYGFGAVYANSTYQNVVSIGIRDNNLDVGPTVDATDVEPDISVE